MTLRNIHWWYAAWSLVVFVVAVMSLVLSRRRSAPAGEPSTVNDHE